MRYTISLFFGLAFCLAAGTASANEAMCNRACLYDFADKYMAAMVKHDPAAVPMTHDARFTEDGQTLRLPDGLWRTATGLGDYKQYAADPAHDTVGGFHVVMENGKPVILGFRLKVTNLKITEMETVVIRPGEAQFGDPTALKKRPEFDQVLPEKQRRSRDELIAIANSYFSGIEKNDGTVHPPFGKCIRIENGMQTSNNPDFVRSDGTPAGPAALTCQKAFALGYYREDSRIRDRRWLLVDADRGLVMAAAFFDHDAALREYKLTDGTDYKVKRTSPWTWQIMELFKIADGKIDEVEAVVLGVPYGMDAGWK